MSKPIDQERADFEAWYLREIAVHHSAISKDSQGHYESDTAMAAWAGWQARASVQPAGGAVPEGYDYGVFIGYLIENCEGHEVAEENLQGWMADMLADPHYGPLFRREIDIPAKTSLQMAVEAAEEEHGSLRAAAKVIGVDAGYLSRLKSGSKSAPGDSVLSALGLERVLRYRTTAPHPVSGEQKPIGKVMSEEEMGIGYDRKAGPVLWFGQPAPGLIYAAPPAAQGVRGLAAFALDLIDGALEGGSFDGGDIQELAEKNGLLVKSQREESCGENCGCAEYGFPLECYRVAPALAARRAQAQGGDV